MAEPHSSRADRTHAGATRTAVLATMRGADQGMTVQQIADELGLHANTVRFHLTRLMQARLVHEEQADPSGPGRPRMVYRATSSSSSSSSSAEAGPHSGNGYRLLVEILAGHLAVTSPAPVQEAIEAGQEWGRHLAERPAPFTRTTTKGAMEQATTILGRLDFVPERSDDDHRMLLHNCPFRPVADDRPNIVCSVHLGIMRGAFAAMEAPLQVTELERFDAPHPCIAHIAPVTTRPTTTGAECRTGAAEGRLGTQEHRSARHTDDSDGAGAGA